jgi:hypothetical protein
MPLKISYNGCNGTDRYQNLNFPIGEMDKNFLQQEKCGLYVWEYKFSNRGDGKKFSENEKSGVYRY